MSSWKRLSVLQKIILVILDAKARAETRGDDFKQCDMRYDVLKVLTAHAYGAHDDKSFDVSFSRAIRRLFQRGFFQLTFVDLDVYCLEKLAHQHDSKLWTGRPTDVLTYGVYYEEKIMREIKNARIEEIRYSDIANQVVDLYCDYDDTLARFSVRLGPVFDDYPKLIEVINRLNGDIKTLHVMLHGKRYSI